MSKIRKEPLVVCCPSIAYEKPNLENNSEKCYYMSSKVSEVHKRSIPTRVKKTKVLSRGEEVLTQFNEIFDSVKELGTSNFEKKDKKKHETNKLLKLGAKLGKGTKMPYHILMGVKKGSEKKEKRRIDYERTSGVVTGKKSSANRKNKSKKGFEKVLHSTRGSFKNGILHVNKLIKK